MTLSSPKGRIPPRYKMPYHSPMMVDLFRRCCRVLTLCLLLLLAACGGGGDLERSYTPNIDAPQPYPTNYRAELLAFLKTYLNDPRQIHDAAIAEPVQRTISDRQRFVVCLRFDARDSLGHYPGASERAAMFLDGRFDRLLELPKVREICAGVSYASFPELERLTR